MEKLKSPPDGRLTNFVCVDKKMVNDTLSQFLEGRKKKDDIDGIIDCFFATMERMNVGRK